ncbi:DUF5988 family protein [Streptomyces aidingensis]|uniref:Uncharacterized protein n=1 Tax=Streptomyces aidingensis TaxID=910347 RepID=A0A1I1SVK7_9ACTN|nr:DUF5988 family protein [Streptomyces aidingensis]SFD47060.1 hypothetical protein SAMN05421773_11676 [Streptomyces aidingensis]
MTSSPPPSASTSLPEPPNVLLRGGPAGPAGPPRVHRVTDVRTTCKLPSGNAYEHYEPTAETVEHEGRLLRVFQWSRRTYMAE